MLNTDIIKQQDREYIAKMVTMYQFKQDMGYIAHLE